MKHRVWAVGAVMLLLAGCGEAEGTRQPTQALVRSTSTPTPTLTATSPPMPTLPILTATQPPDADLTDGAAQSMVGLVIDDLAERQGVAAADIDVRLVEAVEWPGGRLDCEMAGGAGGERLPGYRITLLYEDAVYVYHTDTQGQFVTCLEDEEAPPGEVVILDTQVRALVELARQHLARRLDLPLRRVFVVDAYPVDWPDARLGCILGEETVPPTPVAGYRIVLQVGETTYIYHSDYRQVVFCPSEAVQATVTPQASVTVPPSDQD